MITESTMYWLTRLDSFNIAFTFILFLALIAFAASIGIASGSYWDSPVRKTSRRVMVLSGIAIAISAVVLVFLPTTKEMCAIKVIPAIANNEQVKGLGEKALNLADKWLEGQLKECDGK